MNKMKYIVIHCTATPEGRVVTPDDIIRWHTSPKPKGRGWRQVGYADMILLDANLVNLVHYNYDEFVDSWEITNGVSGLNHEALHIVYVGGCDKEMKPKNTLTAEQEMKLKTQIFEYIRLWPDILIAGHNQFQAKACPSFDTVQMCRKWGVPEKNIYKK